MILTMMANKKGKRGRDATGKIKLLGFRQRKGKVKTIVVPDLRAKILRKIIKQHVITGSTI